MLLDPRRFLQYPAAASAAASSAPAIKFHLQIQLAQLGAGTVDAAVAAAVAPVGGAVLVVGGGGGAIGALYGATAHVIQRGARALPGGDRRDYPPEVSGDAPRGAFRRRRIVVPVVVGGGRRGALPARCDGEGSGGRRIFEGGGLGGVEEGTDAVAGGGSGRRR